MLENLVITKQTFKATQRYFGKNLSELEEEMGAFLPVTIQAELDNLEIRLENKTDEEAMVNSYKFHSILKLYVFIYINTFRKHF